MSPADTDDLDVHSRLFNGFFGIQNNLEVGPCFGIMLRWVVVTLWPGDRAHDALQFQSGQSAYLLGQFYRLNPRRYATAAHAGLDLNQHPQFHSHLHCPGRQLPGVVGVVHSDADAGLASQGA